MDRFIYDVLIDLVGHKVQVMGADDDALLTELTISAVDRSAVNGEEFDAFSVDLTGDEKEHLAQGNYSFKHQSFGDVKLFMSPYAIDRYQICISRKKTK
jgi:uncharacterized protein DUF6916